MIKTMSALVLGAAAIALAAPASASSVVTSNCVSVYDAHGCLFSGNINTGTNQNGNSYLDAQDAYNALPLADITLSLLFQDDDLPFGATFTGTGTTSGTWALPGYDVSFIAVKTSTNFVLYGFSSPISSGNWSTIDIDNGQHALSHLIFFGTPSAVPEPASWALLIAGLGSVGFAMRRRRTAVSFA